mgnify:CR=1 FL=1
MGNNFPNPFNPSTKIEYTIPAGIDVEMFIRLDVFDVLGKKVQTVVDEKQKSGTYKVELSSEELGSGIYFYRLRAGDYTETRKMVLLR